MSNPRPAHLVTPRPRTKGADTKQALMDAARRVFAARGYVGATVPDIAAEAGKSPATFYKYYANKQDMLEAMLLYFLERFDEQVPVPPGHDAADLSYITTVVEVFWAAYREFRAEWKAIMQAAAMDSDLLALWLRMRDRGIRRIVPLIESARQHGARVGHDPLILASNLSAMIEQTAYLWLGLEADALGRPADDRAAVESLAAIWHRALWPAAPVG